MTRSSTRVRWEQLVRPNIDARENFMSTESFLKAVPTMLAELDTSANAQGTDGHMAAFFIAARKAAPDLIR